MVARAGFPLQEMMRRKHEAFAAFPLLTRSVAGGGLESPPGFQGGGDVFREEAMKAPDPGLRERILRRSGEARR